MHHQTTPKVNRATSNGVSINHSHNKELNYNYIADGIYIGTNQCCQTHFNEQLLKDGISADMSLEKERIDAPFGIDFYIWIPIENHTAPTPDQFDFGVHTLEKFVAMQRKIYVHCQNGHGRAPTLVAAYFIHKGKTPEEAEAFIKSKRPTIHLQDAQRLALRDFMMSLRRIEAKPQR